jgi:hypothetical protein
MTTEAPVHTCTLADPNPLGIHTYRITWYEREQVWAIADPYDDSIMAILFCPWCGVRLTQST